MTADYSYVEDKTRPEYVFPSHRLKQKCDPGRTPLVLVACGSFSPITVLHLRMFSRARDSAREQGFEVMGGYLSPVNDDYKKVDLAPANHRIRMCEIAADTTSRWLMVDPWEAESDEYVPTANVLDHFDYHLNHLMGGAECSNGTRKPYRIALLAGADLLQTMSSPGVWDPRDVDHILGDYGVFVLERPGTQLKPILSALDKWEKNIHVMCQAPPYANLSSTQIRLMLRRDVSIDYLTPDEVVNYINEHKLYREPQTPSPE